MTSKDKFFDRSQLGQLAAFMGDALDYVDLPVPAIVFPKELWTGKQVFSLLIRPNAGTRYKILLWNLLDGLARVCVSFVW